MQFWNGLDNYCRRVNNRLLMTLSFNDSCFVSVQYWIQCDIIKHTKQITCNFRSRSFVNSHIHCNALQLHSYYGPSHNSILMVIISEFRLETYPYLVANSFCSCIYCHFLIIHELQCKKRGRRWFCSTVNKDKIGSWFYDSSMFKIGCWLLKGWKRGSMKPMITF